MIPIHEISNKELRERYDEIAQEIERRAMALPSGELTEEIHVLSCAHERTAIRTIGSVSDDGFVDAHDTDEVSLFDCENTHPSNLLMIIEAHPAYTADGV